MKAPDKEYEYSTNNSSGNGGGGADDRGYFAPPPSKFSSNKQWHEDSGVHSPRPPNRYMYPTQPPPTSYYHGHNYDPHLTSPAAAPSSSSSSMPPKYGTDRSGYYYPYARYPAYRAATSDPAAHVTPEHDQQLPPSVSMSPAPTPFPPQSRDADSPAPPADADVDAADANADADVDTAPKPTETSTPKPTNTSAKIRDRDLNDKDVLSGRGGGTNNHAGNKHFRELVDQYRSEYVLSKKWAKREIARSIVMSIRSGGGRFLKKEGSFWRDIGDQKAREKTSQALREGLAAKMRQAYRESGAAMAPTRAATSEFRSSSSRPGDDYYSPRSISGRVHPRTESEYRDPYHYERYDNYEHPYEYYPQPHHPQPEQQQQRQHVPSSPAKRRRLTYDPDQQEAV
mmetsp:Transcript_21863/g.47300  ORF Transcript_21863/g.47300 Transcript_21863/m.47300 type:complete len:398 (+) Transcript_21863:136-1329(+)